MNYFFLNSTSIACVAAAAFLAYEGKEGWGWFLFVAVLLYGTFTVKGSSSETPD